MVNTVLLQSRFNALPFVDDTSFLRVITNAGVTLNTSTPKFGTGCAYFNGASKLSLPYAADLDFQATSFSISAWVNLASDAPTFNFLLGNRISDSTGGSGLVLAHHTSDGLYLDVTKSDNTQLLLGYSNFVLTRGQYYFVELVRDGDNWFLFADGNIVFSTTASGAISNVSSTGLSFGGAQGGIFSTDRTFKGYIDEVQIRNYAWHTANYTPPTSEAFIYSISGTLSESLAATDFLIRAYNLATGEFVSEITSTGGSYIIATNSPAPVFIVVLPKQGDIWKPSTVYALNALAFPTNPDVTPYYYKRVGNAGTSSTTEPTWVVTVGGQCSDGIWTDCWECVERLVQPIIKSPLNPKVSPNVVFDFNAGSSVSASTTLINGNPCYINGVLIQ